ncbi:MAG: hypothetical protein LUG91_01840 [Ruminococcus sp.]|nr:hypothetical protein [Ruminococcus sp.]
MIGFGETNEEFGKVPPVLISIEEIKEGQYATNSLLIKIATETNIYISIKFESYIMHLTRNESYTVWDDYEVRNGNYLVKFSKSRLIDFYDVAIIHTEDYSFPGRGQHYGVYTGDHIIDIIADCIPEIIVETNKNHNL